MVNFSFIVLFHNNTDTDRVVDSLLREAISGDEVIVVDDHSKEESLRIFDRFGDSIRIVHTDRQGNRGYNRNFGARFAKNDYLFFSDGDIVLLPDAVSILRTTMAQGYVGAVGNVVAGGNTPAQMNLITGVDFLNLVRTDLSAERLIDLDVFYDRRQGSIYDKVSVDCMWELFYSGYCVAEKAAFDAVGGFETEFVGWGAEDAELGYRLQKKGRLAYSNGAYGVHIPHDRNLYRCRLSNRINMYRFLAKDPSNSLELHLSFGNSPRSSHAMAYIRQRLLEENLTEYPFALEENCICVNELTAEHPNGCVKFTGCSPQVHTLDLLGLALPFRNKNFRVGYCTENLFIYPQFFATAILCELLRVSEEIRILKVDRPKRIRWDSAHYGGLRGSAEVIYTTSNLWDLDVMDCGDYYCIRDGLAAKMSDHFLIEENFYRPELFAGRERQYLLLNLTGEELTQEERTELSCRCHVQIRNCCWVDVSLPAGPVSLSQILADDFYRMHTPILYLIPDRCEIDCSDHWWSYSFRQHDIIARKA